MGAPKLLEGGWGQAFPKFEAILTLSEGMVIGTGALNLRLPTGASAYGSPSQRSVPFDVLIPWNFPLVRLSRSVLEASEDTAQASWTNEKDKMQKVRRSMLVNISAQT